MANRKLARMGLEDSIAQKLAGRNLYTAKDVLGRTEIELMDLLDMRADLLEEAIMCVSRATCPPCRNVSEMLEERQGIGQAPSHLPTRLDALDEALYGGLPLGAITELVGPAGLGKTQLCLMMSVFATLPEDDGGLNGSVVYIDTENKLSSQRLVEIAQTRLPEFFSGDIEIERLTKQVLVVVPQSASELLERLQGLEEVIIERRVRLVVVDSIAALARTEFGRDELAERQQLLSKQASLLKFLAETFRIPVLVTNHVMALRPGSSAATADFDFVPGKGFGASRSPREDALSTAVEETVTAALGTKWAHCVNIRLILESYAGQRFLKIGKAPMAPCLAFPYIVTSSGLQLASEAVHDEEGTGQQTTIRNE
eukprot:TRINITY_DN3586_c0_g1_i2.p1 TRINITY_DN3586_c0_g1~~TRINITY_DN3586_c0_g1_i2.p1  ORF type:complete len:370 (+),score=75.48 TRINITY_DN3586_c0_g1_i2:518-1627(+)